MDLISKLTIILGLVFLGIICGRKNYFKNSHIEAFETYLFKIALPCSLFIAASDKDFFNLVDMRYICSYLVCFCIIALIKVVYFRRKNSTSELCINTLATGYVNAAIYTLPIISFLHYLLIPDVHLQLSLIVYS